MPVLSPHEILGYFLANVGDYDLSPLKQGFINNTFLVRAGGHTRFILQEINTSVFPQVEALMGNMQTALSYLDAPDYQAIKLMATLKGKTYLDAGDSGCWRLMEFISGSLTYNTTQSTEIAREAGRIIMCFHRLLGRAPVNQFVDVIPGFHDLDSRLAQYHKALSEAQVPRLKLAHKAIGMMEELTREPLLPKLKNLPLRVCHNDTKLNNILFSQDKKALCLIDLDTLMKGHFLYDFGDAVRTIVNSAPEDERVLRNIEFSRPLFVAFVEGMATEPGLLTEAELHQLAHGAVYMPLLHGVRALTDYLQGDLYYQTSYEGQNLDRSMSLLTFAQRAREEIPFMELELRRLFR